MKSTCNVKTFFPSSHSVYIQVKRAPNARKIRNSRAVMLKLVYNIPFPKKKFRMGQHSCSSFLLLLLGVLYCSSLEKNAFMIFYAWTQNYFYTVITTHTCLAHAPIPCTCTDTLHMHRHTAITTTPRRHQVHKSCGQNRGDHHDDAQFVRTTCSMVAMAC